MRPSIYAPTYLATRIPISKLLSQKKIRQTSDALLLFFVIIPDLRVKHRKTGGLWNYKINYPNHSRLC